MEKFGMEKFEKIGKNLRKSGEIQNSDEKNIKNDI